MWKRQTREEWHQSSLTRAPAGVCFDPNMLRPLHARAPLAAGSSRWAWSPGCTRCGRWLRRTARAAGVCTAGRQAGRVCRPTSRLVRTHGIVQAGSARSSAALRGQHRMRGSGFCLFVPGMRPCAFRARSIRQRAQGFLPSASHVRATSHSHKSGVPLSQERQGPSCPLCSPGTRVPLLPPLCLLHPGTAVVT